MLHELRQKLHHIHRLLLRLQKPSLVFTCRRSGVVPHPKRSDHTHKTPDLRFRAGAEARSAAETSAPSCVIASQQDPSCRPEPPR